MNKTRQAYIVYWHFASLSDKILKRDRVFGFEREDAIENLKKKQIHGIQIYGEIAITSITSENRQKRTIKSLKRKNSKRRPLR